MNKDYRGEIYRAFNLFPLPAGDPAYVDCVDVRGDRDVVQELADVIGFAEPGDFTCQLYTGARGCGKSTERLTDSGYCVVYLEVGTGSAARGVLPSGNLDSIFARHSGYSLPGLRLPMENRVKGLWLRDRT